MENKQVELNTTELKKFLTHIINNNRSLQKEKKNSVSVEIIGESGLGKTSVALQLAKELNLNCIKLNLAQIEELGDLVGYPIRQFEMSNDTVVTEAKPGEKTSAEWVDENAIDSYRDKGFNFTGKKRMSYCPPEWIADKQGGGILILDDWNRADLRFIQAVMELVDRQEYISWKLPQDWHIILTANPDNGEYLVNTIDNAQRTRFVTVNLKWDEKEWAMWAEKSGIDSRCINFVLLHPEVVGNKVNPRSITTFFNCISSLEDFNDTSSLSMIQMVGEGSVGPEFATLFTKFIHNHLDKLISPKEILTNPDEEHIIKEIKKTLGSGAKFRADISSLMGIRIANFALAYAEKNGIPDAMIKRLSLLVTDEEISQRDVAFHIVKKVIANNKPKFQKLLSQDKKVMEMALS